LWHSNSSFAFGGDTPITGATEEYDGSTWTTSPASFNTARTELAGTGTQASALAFGGTTGSITAATEEYTTTGTKGIKTITVS
jgi:hypothetical protein